MLAIHTKYLGPTDFKGSRIKATANKQSLTISLDNGSAHPERDAAIALCNKLGWRGTLCEGSDENGHVFVFVHAEDCFTV